MSFGLHLKQLRQDLGLSQVALAGRLGSTQRHVSFLETGRSRPSREMLGRMVTELRLTIAQRAALFEASGFRNPYPRRSFASDAVTEALDTIEARVLRHWPFPAFVMDADWTLLRLNPAAEAMFGRFRDADGVLNFYAVLLAPEFVPQIVNWQEVAPIFYFRLQLHAQTSAILRRAFDDACDAGYFDSIARTVAGQDEVPVYVPVKLQQPGGPLLSLTSLLGKLVSVHDALVEGFEIEMMVPLDDTSEAVLGGLPQ